MGKKLAGVAAIVLAGAAVVAMKAGGAEGGPPAASATQAPATQPTTQPVAQTQAADNLHEVRKGTLKFEVKADGVFQAVGAPEVKIKLQAYSGPLVVTRVAPPGSVVKKGDVLLEIDTTHIEWALRSAENELALARANMKKAEADLSLGQKSDALSLRLQEDAVRVNREALQWWQEMEGPQALKNWDLQVQNVLDSIGDQEDELDQLRSMYKSEELTNATADIVLRRAIRRLERAKVVLGMNEERRDKYKSFDHLISTQRLTNAVEQSAQQLDALKVSLAQATVKREAGMSGARIALEQAEKKFAELKQDLAQFQLSAATDGMVIYGNVEDGAWRGGEYDSIQVGEKVAADRVLMRIVHPGRLCVEMNLPESKAFWVKQGMAARVLPSSLPGVSYEGVCGQPQAVPKGNPPSVSFELTVNLEQPDQRLLPGMKCSVQIDAGTLEDVLLVPLEAIVDGEVTVKTADGEEKRLVTVGRSDGKMIHIREGLSEGEKLVIAK